MSTRCPSLVGSPVWRSLVTLALGVGLAARLAADQPLTESLAESGRAAHAMLTRLCDDFGGRLTGSPANRGAMDQLERELRELGLDPVRQPFSMPGWERRADQVELVAPLTRPLRVAALSYTQPHRAFTATVIDVKSGAPAEWGEQTEGKIALLSPSSVLQTREMVRVAQQKGIRGVLFINREAGGQLLARTGSFVGEALPLPVYSLTQEEGYWLQRLLGRGREVRVRVETKSRCVPVRTANLRVILPGTSPERVIVGAHFDSWDLGQGAMDNGLGTAQLYALARALHGRPLARTIELIWFNGEEQGLWGSRTAAESLGDTPVVAMVNLDMVGVPIAVNALGDDALVPALERWHHARATKLPQGVQNINWFGSDHTPYQLAGVRAVTFNAPIDRASVRYYHDLADTIDKLPEAVVTDSTVTIGEVVMALAADRELTAQRRSAADTKTLFTRFNLERRMQAIHYWPYPATP